MQIAFLVRDGTVSNSVNFFVFLHTVTCLLEGVTKEGFLEVTRVAMEIQHARAF